MKDLVLVGGGHSHVQVLRDFAMQPPLQTRLTVVLDRPVAVYSGMVPGFVAGQYSADELEIDVVPLARRAGARVILSAASRIDSANCRVELDGRPPLPYDIASLDVGSSVAGLDVPGVRRLALPTRPIGRFVGALEIALANLAARQGQPLRLVVVGGGVGGVEVAFTLQSRLHREGFDEVPVVLLHDGERILPGASSSLAERVENRAGARGIELRCRSRVTAVEDGRVRIDKAAGIPFDLLAWVTGAVGTALLRDSDMPLEERGFVRTEPTLLIEGCDNLFAVGDCATLIEAPATPKAGVFAVRQGPFLKDNLVAALRGGKLRNYRPQGEFLTLLNLGDGTAIGSKWGRSFEGRWVMRWKDHIDRKFVRRFQVLDKRGAARAEFPAMAADVPMLCGGCAAKVGQSALKRALDRIGAGADDGDVLLGLCGADDAAAYRTPAGDIVTTSVDLFSAFVDDPFVVGRVAAVNASSDLLATGVEPRWALAIVAVPEEADAKDSEEILFQTLAGARATFDAMGVTLLGGHTTTAAKLMVGFVVDGFASSAESLLRGDGLEEGHVLVLTKPLGTGVLFHADMQGLATGRWLRAVLTSVLRSNARALPIAQAAGASGVTDVTGFGLVGHLAEMLRASAVSAQIELSALPALPGALELLGCGLRSTFHAENAKARKGIVLPRGDLSAPRVELLFDPQTAGGLLFGVSPQAAPDAIRALVEAGDKAAAVIGRIEPARPDGALIEVVR